MKNYKIVYIINHTVFFVSHRLPLAIGAKRAGFNVALLTGQYGNIMMEKSSMELLIENKIEFRRTIFRSSGINPIVEFIGLIQLIYFVYKLKPSIIHCASPKGILYGGIAARLCNTRALVLAISGMGYLHSKSFDHGIIWIILQTIYSKINKFSFGHTNQHVIVQNNENFNYVINNLISDSKRITIIPGSGVDLTLFDECSFENKSKMVILPARMLKDKGVLDFVAAARKLKKILPEWDFCLAGEAGYESPTAISESELLTLNAEGVVRWVGHVNNMIPYYKLASIVCLPSYYGEGMPKTLLEAAAAGCAVVTTDVAGCREAVESGVTGDLVPIRNIDALADTLLSLMKDESRRRSYGLKGQERAREFFSVDSVVNQTMKIYKELLNHE